MSDISDASTGKTGDIISTGKGQAKAISDVTTNKALVFKDRVTQERKAIAPTSRQESRRTNIRRRQRRPRPVALQLQVVTVYIDNFPEAPEYFLAGDRDPVSILLLDGIEGGTARVDTNTRGQNPTITFTSRFAENFVNITYFFDGTNVTIFTTEDSIAVQFLTPVGSGIFSIDLEDYQSNGQNPVFSFFATNFQDNVNRFYEPWASISVTRPNVVATEYAIPDDIVSPRGSQDPGDAYVVPVSVANYPVFNTILDINFNHDAFSHSFIFDYLNNWSQGNSFRATVEGGNSDLTDYRFETELDADAVDNDRGSFHIVNRDPQGLYISTSTTAYDYGLSDLVPANNVSFHGQAIAPRHFAESNFTTADNDLYDSETDLTISDFSYFIEGRDPGGFFANIASLQATLFVARQLEAQNLIINKSNLVSNPFFLDFTEIDFGVNYSFLDPFDRFNTDPLFTNSSVLRKQSNPVVSSSNVFGINYPDNWDSISASYNRSVAGVNDDPELYINSQTTNTTLFLADDNGNHIDYTRFELSARSDDQLNDIVTYTFFYNGAEITSIPDDLDLEDFASNITLRNFLTLRTRQLFVVNRDQLLAESPEVEVITYRMGSTIRETDRSNVRVQYPDSGVLTGATIYFR